MFEAHGDRIKLLGLNQKTSEWSFDINCLSTSIR